MSDYKANQESWQDKSVHCALVERGLLADSERICYNALYNRVSPQPAPQADPGPLPQKLNVTRFLSDLDFIRRQRKTSWYRVFRETFVVNIYQIVRGKRGLSRQSALTLASWAGLDLSEYEVAA